MSARWTDLRTRTISAAILGAAALFITWWDPISFDAMLLLGSVILLYEWQQLTNRRAFSWLILGVLYIGAAMASLHYFRRWLDWDGIFWFFAIVWSADIGAYFVGKRFGRRKIAPRISPGKTWEGLAGGVLASIFVTCLFVTSIGFDPGRFSWEIYPFAAAFGAMLALAGFAGDLFESWLKRRAGVKDSGKLIPGHGGLFDRVDSLLACAIALVFIHLLIRFLHGNG